MRTVFLVLAILWSQLASADEIDRLIGTWLSPDGQTKQEFVREFNGEWINNRMWFMTSSGWKLVSQGAMYRKPGDATWHGVVRSTDMEGIVLFEFTLEAASENDYVTRNTAYMDSGETMATEEEWYFVSDDRWSYTVFSLSDGERKPWIRGEWRRADVENTTPE